MSELVQLKNSISEPEQKRREESIAQPSALSSPSPMLDLQAPPVDLASLRTRLSGKKGKQYWRSLEELAETDEC
jgi:hypothetical protein